MTDFCDWAICIMKQCMQHGVESSIMFLEAWLIFRDAYCDGILNPMDLNPKMKVFSNS